jgi:lipoprotein-anchoring transpeptidase ErfK/SrfK
MGTMSRRSHNGVAVSLAALSAVALSGLLGGCGAKPAEAGAVRNLSVVADHSQDVALQTPDGVMAPDNSLVPVGTPTPDNPAAPANPETPDNPAAPGVVLPPDNSVTPDNPQAPATPQTPENPQTPDNSAPTVEPSPAAPTGDPSVISLNPAPEQGKNQTGLPEPFLDTILPEGIPQIEPDQATIGQIATPKKVFTVAYGAIGSRPMLALNEITDDVLGMDAQWAVVGQRDGWVRVMTPVGRGSLPSEDPSQVNHHAVWVQAKDVTLAPAQYEIDVDTEAYTLTIRGPEGTNTFHVGVGVKGKTDTPKGLCYVVGHVTIQSGEPGLLTNCQSEMIDGYGGADDAATAIHVADGFDPEVGGDVSNGCVRVTSEDFATYLAHVPAGTPIVIK